jgi:hypothetical protein
MLVAVAVELETLQTTLAVLEVQVAAAMVEEAKIAELVLLVFLILALVEVEVALQVQQEVVLQELLLFDI